MIVFSLVLLVLQCTCECLVEISLTTECHQADMPRLGPHHGPILILSGSALSQISQTACYCEQRLTLGNISGRGLASLPISPSYLTRTKNEWSLNETSKRKECQVAVRDYCEGILDDPQPPTVFSRELRVCCICQIEGRM